MSKPVISVEGLGKVYKLSHQRQPAQYVTLREVITRKLAAPFRALNGEAHKSGNGAPGSDIHPVQAQTEDFWALKDVSFEINQGDVVGIIGRNGAGKSTLLKVLSRITEPSAGRIRISGRVASLLEVGTGFHPELTGRENVFLNGAILGMHRAEIKQKFDEIVAFAEVEKFLDTPVKRYSSGMYVRLAFAVAAHLEPEILVVDEVLAVGDGEFQKKCLGKMDSVARSQGRTVLFVSHNMAAVQALCAKGLLLVNGKLDASGDIASCISRYQRHPGAANNATWKRAAGARTGPLVFRELSAQLQGEQPNIRLEVDVSFNTESSHRPAICAFDILDAIGTPVMQALPSLEPFITPANSKRRFRFAINLPGLVPGQYQLTAWVGPHNNETYDIVERCASFGIENSPTPGRTFPHSLDHGFLVPPCTFTTTPL
jgi:lipopolysaccharide transport system ATP-binding protein